MADVGAPAVGLVLVEDGKAGADSMYGQDGDDTYRAGSTADLAIETNATAAGGFDRVLSAVSFTLGANVERLVLEGTNAISGTGSALANAIAGNNGNNLINGMLGSDSLSGGLGIDNFYFTTALGPANIDRIADFTPADDLIRLDDAVFTGMSLGYLRAAAFHVGTASADASDRIIYDSATGMVYFDADGLGGAAQTAFAKLSAGLALTTADFYVF
ncbi:MAG: hypothetical protein HC855_16425 [Rhizobiales bacterium]|nr:hypothetical protein [Hyphomicrobiales bacterium]